MKNFLLVFLLTSFSLLYSQNVTTFAGSGVSGQSDGAGTEASFMRLTGVTLDNLGNLYVLDFHKIRKISPEGLVTTFSGKNSAGSQDGLLADATFSAPLALVFDSQWNLFILDSDNSKIRKISASGVVSTFAGSGYSISIDGVGIDASFKGLKGITIDENDNLYVSEYAGKIRKISSSGVVTTIAGKEQAGYRDGTGINALFQYPTGLYYKSGSIYIADTYNSRIRKLDINSGIVSTYSGNGNFGYINGHISIASYNLLSSFSSYENYLFVCEYFGNRVRLINLDTKIVSTYAGSTYGDLNGYGEAAKFSQLRDIVVDPQRKILYVSDVTNNKIKKIDMVSLLKTNTNELNKVVLYPNPVEDILTYKTNKMIRFTEIYSLDGKLVKKFDVQNNQISLGLLTNGTYIIKLIDDSGSILQTKIIKK